MTIGMISIDGIDQDSDLVWDGTAGVETFGQYPMVMHGEILGMILFGIHGVGMLAGVGIGVGDGTLAGAGIPGPGEVDFIIHCGARQYTMEITTEGQFTWLITIQGEDEVS